MRIDKLLILLTMAISTPALAENLTLAQSLELALSKAPRLDAQRARAEALSAEGWAELAPSSPMVGYSQMGDMTQNRSWMVEQKIDFPAKYIARKSAIANQSEAEEHALDELRNRVRSETITRFYRLYAVGRIEDFVRQDLQKLRELSRTAESRYAAGKDPQHESMKAHVSQTEAESRLIALTSERREAEASLRALLGEDGFESSLSFSLKSLPVPEIRQPLKTLKPEGLVSSPSARKTGSEVDAAASRRTLGLLEFAPDFEVKYEKTLPGSSMDTSGASIGVSVPLWFWGPAAKSSATGKNLVYAEKSHDANLLDLRSRFESLRASVGSRQELLAVLDTSLIPQATTTYRTTLAGYRTGRGRFLDVLDSERSLLQVQISYYRTLVEYVQSLTELEALLGERISDLP